MLIKIADVCDHSLRGFKHDQNDLFHKSKHKTHTRRNIQLVFNSNDKKGIFQPLRSRTGLHHYGNNNRRKNIVYGVEPGASPSGPPTNILSWAVGVAIAIVIPLISYKWGPLLKSKVEGALQTAEDVAEAVEKVAEKVEKVAEDIADDLPTGGKLREVIDIVEKFAEKTADDAGAIDDFIDKVQEQEEKEKAESLVESLKDESKKPPDSKQEKPNDGN